MSENGFDQIKKNIEEKTLYEKLTGKDKKKAKFKDIEQMFQQEVDELNERILNMCIKCGFWKKEVAPDGVVYWGGNYKKLEFVMVSGGGVPLGKYYPELRLPAVIVIPDLRTAKEKLEGELYQKEFKEFSELGEEDFGKLTASELKERFPAMFAKGHLDSIYGKLLREEQLKKGEEE